MCPSRIQYRRTQECRGRMAMDGLSAEPFIDQVMVAPIVGNLNDDDGDGFVSAYDTPDIVIVAFDSRDGPMGDQGAWVDGRLLAIDGATGAVHWSRDGFTGKAVPPLQISTMMVKSRLLPSTTINMQKRSMVPQDKPSGSQMPILKIPIPMSLSQISMEMAFQRSSPTTPF